MITRQFMVFVMVGVVSALIDVSVMQALLHAGVHLTIATAAGFGLGLVANYLLHSKVTFQHHATMSAAAMTKFALVVLVNFGITLAFVYLSQRFVGSALAGKLASLPVVAINGFVLSKFWVFR